ncbi:MAG: hypothetical protein V4653_07665 [Pseudomonadota bacterium]
MRGMSLATLALCATVSGVAQRPAAAQPAEARPTMLLRETVTGMPRGERQEIQVLTATIAPGQATVFHTHAFPVTVHVLEGSPMWRETTGKEAAAELRLSAFRWLKDLFAVLEGERERPEARRLGACWYYTASEANFDEDSESAELRSGEVSR